MQSMEVTIVKLQEELKKSHRDIVHLLQERDALKKAYSMQIDLREALEKRIETLERR